MKLFKSTVPLFLIMLCATFTVVAQEGEDKKEEEKPKTIAELTKDSEQTDGLFTLFRNTKTGSLQMLIKADQLDKEYIYFSQAANGVVQAGLFTGAYMGNGVISLRRHYDRIELVAENFSFYFDPENPLAKAADANISDAVLAVSKIEAEDKDNGNILINADKIFLSEQLQQIKFPLSDDADAKTTFTIGKLDDGKSKILATRSYPMNTDVEVEYVYNNPEPKVRGEAEVTDSRNVSIRLLHSLIEMPENDYTPRFADARVGTFDIQVTDLTSTSPTPYRDLVRRWHLVKKDPSAEVSDPVEPITWWIENTTPHEWRDLIRDATLEWNKSFEKAGISNAMEVKVQPDDADWDYGDIRYNVLRWTSSPNPPFGGYGPHFANPRTGQIIGADVMLEATFMNRHAKAKWFLDDGFNAVENNPNLMGHYCSLGQGLKDNMTLARTFSRFSTYGDAADEQILHDTMHYLILHELGHTLGMNHNMKATNLLSFEEAFDMDVVKEKGLAGSVMDYPAVNYPPRSEDITLFYMVTPGPYDDWFIQFSYDPDLDDMQTREALLARSAEPQLAFGNDADDMRGPGRGLDPRINIYDMSGDGIVYASERIGLIQDTLDDMGPEAITEGSSYQEIYDGVAMMLQEWGRSAAVTSRFVGGVYVDRSTAGQSGAGEPFQPVPEARQKQAMEVLHEQVFAPQAMQIPSEVLNYAAQQRRGFNHFGSTEDPKIHDAKLAVHKNVLDQLLHPVVLKRITDTGLYGNTYTLGEVFTDLNNAVFEEDEDGNVNSVRQGLQMEYVQRLAKIARDTSGGYHTPAVSMAVYSLGEIKDSINDKGRVNTATRAHVAALNLVIDRALSTDS